MKVGKVIENTLIVVIIAIAIWFVWSYVDVLAHNEPLTGDFAYSKYNLLVNIADWVASWR